MSKPRVGVVVMASGEGKRFGGNKLMTDFLGRPMLSHALASALAVIPPFVRVVVVTRSEDVAALAEGMGVAAVLHALPEQSDTIRLGVRAMRGVKLDGCMFLVGDQPLMRPQTLETLVAAFAADTSRIVRAANGDRPGNPVVFPAALMPELEMLAPGETGAAVVRRHCERVLLVQVSSKELADVDTPDDLARLLDDARGER